jgi:hypothetical protein
MRISTTTIIESALPRFAAVGERLVFVLREN